MDVDNFQKLLFFWLIFYVTPGPVWLAVMAMTAHQSLKQIWRFFLTIFVVINLTVQVLQAVLSALFVEGIVQIFGQIGFIFYALGGGYILYLAHKAYQSQQTHTNLDLSLANFAIVMLLSPKIWLLFPSGALIGAQLNLGAALNMLVYVGLMFLTANAFFFFYVWVGKVGKKILEDNFSYLVSALLAIFGVFLWIQGVQSLLVSPLF